MINSIRFFLVFKSVNCVVNGDPDSGSGPRLNDDGTAYCTDVFLSHQFREWYNYKGHDIMFDGAKTVSDFKGMSDEDALKKYVDARIHGMMLQEEKNVNLKATRAFNMTRCQTRKPVVSHCDAITRCMATRDDAKTNSGMGSKQTMEEAIWVCNAVMSGRRAEKNRMTQQDIELLIEAMQNWPRTMEGPRMGKIEIVHFHYEIQKDNLVDSHTDLSWADQYIS